MAERSPYEDLGTLTQRRAFAAGKEARQAEVERLQRFVQRQAQTEHNRHAGTKVVTSGVILVPIEECLWPACQQARAVLKKED